MLAFIPCGETRVPLPDEWFLHNGTLRQCTAEFWTHNEYPIYRTVEWEPRAEAERAIVEAAKRVETWWLSQGMNESELGAPECIFAIRQAISAAKAAGIGVDNA